MFPYTTLPRIPLLIALATLATSHPAIAMPSRVQLELEATLASLNERGHLFREDGTPLEIAMSPRQRWELGAVLDLAAEGPGLPVLAVTPGGAAARLGVAVGDRIKTINGRELGDGADVGAQVAAAVDAGNGDLELSLERGGKPLSLSGAADGTTLPGYRVVIEAGAAPGSRCGVVSLQQLNAPRENLYPLRILAINGRAIFDPQRMLYTFEPGRHELVVDEAIASQRFPGAARIERDRERRYQRTTKTLVLDIVPGVQYRIGARFLPETGQDIRGNAYWEPVVARRSSQACQRSGIPAPARRP